MLRTVKIHSVFAKMELEETIKKKNARLSARQLDILLSYMETNKDLREGKINPHLTKVDRKRKWCELAEILNAEGRLFCSAVKTPDQWRKVSLIYLN